MKVILLRDIRGVGKKNEIKEVKDGYARNVLLPQKLVAVATSDALRRFEITNKKLAEDHKKNLQKISEDIERLKNITLTFSVRANEQGEIFGSVSAKDIKQSLYEKGFETIKVNLEKPIKNIGEYEIGVNLGERTVANLKLIVTRL